MALTLPGSAAAGMLVACHVTVTVVGGGVGGTRRGFGSSRVVMTLGSDVNMVTWRLETLSELAGAHHATRVVYCTRHETACSAKLHLLSTRALYR